MAVITYNGKSTKDFNMRVENALTHELSVHDVETEAVPGRDGVLLIDNQRLEPVERAFPLRMEDDVYPNTTAIAEWLGIKGWHDLELSWDDDFIYQATVINTISIEEVLKQLGKLRVAFLMHPIKYFKENPEKNVSKDEVITNAGNVVAKPLIKLTGDGDTVITINGRRTVLEDIQDTIILDMKNRMVYSGNLSAWENVVREKDAEFPYLDVGENKISWTGDFEMKITINGGVRI